VELGVGLPLYSSSKSFPLEEVEMKVLFSRVHHKEHFFLVVLACCLLLPSMISALLLFRATTTLRSTTTTTRRRRISKGIASSHALLYHSNKKSSSPSNTATETHSTLVPGAVYVEEMEVKKSRFLAYAVHVATWEEAARHLAEIKAEHPKARHWCYAVRCGGGGSSGSNPLLTERSSDDGEPAGTAGAPILQALRGANDGVTDALCVVVRYFGGIKLGAGGLIRAYGGAARNVLERAPVQTVEAQASLRLTVPDASHVGTVYDLAAKVQGSASGEEYGADGSLTVTITCPAAAEEQLREGLLDATRGSVIFDG
jgi:uncharacterized YigZ family protein